MVAPNASRVLVRSLPMRDPSVKHVALAGLTIALLLTLVASASSLWDRDEPRFARAAVEMLEHRDPLVPTFNAQLRPDKPAMVYWLMMPGVATLGPTALAVRFPSILGMTLASVFTFFIGRRLLSAQVGWWAMWILPTSLQSLIIGTAATADGLLLAWITLGIWAFVELADRPAKSWRWWVVLTLALGCGQLTKGPVALAVVGLTIGFAWGIGRHHLKLSKAFWPGLAASVLASVGLFALWYLPADAATGGELGRQAIGRHLVQRITTPLESHGGSGVLGYLATLPTYVVVLFVGFFPWILFLPCGLSALIRQHIGQPRQRAILWAWMVPTFVMMSLVATKLPHYILPIYPALAIVCGAAIQAKLAGRLSDKDRDWLRGGIWFFGPVNFLLAGALMIGPWFLGGKLFILTGTLAGLFLLILGEVTVRLQRQERVAQAAGVLIVGVCVAMVGVAFVLLPQVEQRLKPSPQLALHVGEYDPAVDVVTAGYDEPSLVFYLNRPADRPLAFLGTDPQNVATWAAQPSHGKLVITSEVLEETRQRFGDLGLVELWRMPTINYSARGKRKELVVMLKQPMSDKRAVDQQREKAAEISSDKHITDVVRQREDARQGDDNPDR